MPVDRVEYDGLMGELRGYTLTLTLSHQGRGDLDRGCLLHRRGHGYGQEPSRSGRHLK